MVKIVSPGTSISGNGDPQEQPFSRALSWVEIKKEVKRLVRTVELRGEDELVHEFRVLQWCNGLA